MRIFVGCSSIEHIPVELQEDCKKLLENLLKDNDLVFGASSEGLMGVAYKIAKKNHRLITGICPKVYETSLASLKCDQVEITHTMLESTLKIYQNSDVIVFLPGGFGSIYEFFTANYAKICKEITIPIILYNSCGYYNSLLSFIHESSSKNMIREKELGNYWVANTIDEVMTYLENI